MLERLKILSSSDAGCWLGIEGESVGATDFKAQKIVVRLGADGKGDTVLDAGLQQPFKIDGRLLTDPGPDREFKPVVDAVRELYRDVARRLAVQEITWSQAAGAGTFFKLPFGFAANAEGKFHGDARLRLYDLVTSADPKVVVAEFSARAEVNATITDGAFSARRSFAFVVVLRKSGLPALRIDLDDFNVGLPEFSFPKLSLAENLSLDLAGTLQGAARALERLSDAVRTVADKTEIEVVFTVASGAAPKLVINPATPFSWSVEANGAPAKFNVKIRRINGGPDFAEINGLSVKGTATSVTLTGKATIRTEIDLKSGQRRFGPLVVRWEGAKVTPIATALVAESADYTLRGLVHVDRLMLYAADDPSTVIAVTCDVDVTPSGVRVQKLELVEPYPINLIEAAGDTLIRGAAAVLRFLARIKLTTGADAENLKKLLKALAAIASAAARATVFIEEVAEQAAQLLRQALIGIAELVGKLVTALERLIADAAGEVGRYLAIEVRVATDPFEIRQVLVSLRDPSVTSKGRSLSALGFRLDISDGWELGLLLDFVAQPGAYLIASRGGTPGKPFATLSTDLWLQRPGPAGSPVAPVRDANDVSGDRGQAKDSDKPLVAVKGGFTNASEEVVLILAALTGGQTKFFQRIKSEVARKTIGNAGNISIVTATGPLDYVPIGKDDLEVTVEFQKDRVLPLLGMGEPGKESSDGFLSRLKNSLSQTVWVKGFEPKPIKDRSAGAALILGVKAAGVESEITLELSLNLDTFEAKLKGADAVFPLKSRRIEERALGLVWVVEQTDEAKRAENAPVDMFKLSFDSGEAAFQLNEQNARMEIRFPDLSSDGRGVVLAVTEFRVSRAGLDLTAKATANPVRLNGINMPFQFTTGEFVVRSNRLSHASIGGRGSLPRELVGEVDCKILLDFKQDQQTNEIVLQSGKVEFDKKGDPIKCHSTRFTLTINELEIAFVRDGGYHFFFLVTGSLEFTPRDDEFTSGLLKFLKDVRMDLERTPLSADPRVLLKHISFQKALNPKKKFSLFNLFEFELRGFGFHPASPKFDGKPPAMNISGQIAFAEIGDVMQPKIDFHGLWIAPPAKDGALPRFKADGLGVEIGLSGAAKIRGEVLAVDKDTTTLEGRELAPPGIEANGFLGQGQVTIEGFATLSASMGFLEVSKKETPDQRKKAFFLYLQIEEISVEIPVVIWTFYLREVGFGFGYRYTLRGIEEAENAKSTAQLVKVLDEVSKRQGDLARYSAWMPDPQGDHVTLALRGAFQCFMPPSQTYDEQQEKTAEEPFFFDIVAALRSDMTFLMATRGWVATNYYDFHTDTEGDKIRSRPGFRGYLYISAPRSELLSRNIGDHTGYVGKRLGNIEVLEKALKSVDWSSTLYINPRLFHFELGWPNELVVRLRDDPNFRVMVRGGMIFRVAEDGILWGYNIEADAFIIFSGGAGGGSIGVAVEASLVAKFVARLIAFISWRLKGTLIYGLISLDANLRFSVRAWMEIDLGITSFTIRISFTFQVQFSAAVEIALSTEGVGARVTARVGISVFGCTLSAHINFTIGSGRLDAARARVERFMALGIANEQTPDPVKAMATSKGDDQIAGAADRADTRQQVPTPPSLPPPQQGQKPSIRRSALGRPIKQTNFWLVLYRPRNASSDGKCYGLLVPREPDRNFSAVGADDALAGFYTAPVVKDDPSLGKRSESKTSHTLICNADLAKIDRWDPKNGWVALPKEAADTIEVPVTANWNKPIPGQGSDGKPVTGFTLAHLFDECFLYDSDWTAEGYRETKAWTEPPSRRHERAEPPSGIDETARNAERDKYQKDRIAHMDSNPWVAAVYEARSTVLSMFIDQFVALAEKGAPSVDDLEAAHVTDLGLVFRANPADFAKLQNSVQIRKADYEEKAGSITVFNPSGSWFANSDPILNKTKKEKIDTAGIKLDWRLRMPWIKSKGDAQTDPEQFLHHYQIICELDGKPRWDEPKLLKPAATFGGTREGETSLLRPDWQFIDDLSDLADDQRNALLTTIGEENALKAAVAWVKVFGERDKATLTYSVTPVDIAGTRATERAFVVTAVRPPSPIRPAEAELRIFLRKSPSGPAYPPHQKDDRKPGNLGIVLALRDKAASGDADETIGNVRVSRRYRLIVDPEDVVPAGNYGSDGLTDSLRNPQAMASQEHADEVPFEFGRARFAKCQYKKTLAEIEPDEDARATFTHWLRLGGNPIDDEKPPEILLPKAEEDRLFSALWRRDGANGGRVACRFYLQTLMTVQRIKNKKPVGAPVEFESRRVPVSTELVADTVTSDEQRLLMRPEAFEWPVRLDLPPLGPGQVRARAGFALFRAPANKATLTELIDPPKNKSVLRNVRDPERRILTTVEWDAVPDWADGKAVAGDAPHPLHASTIGGFDLHELDIDDLAPLDTASGETGQSLPFAQDAAMWRRARRVARVQQLPASAAMLTPHTNDDLIGWQAHYPSETWRVDRSDGGAESTGHNPIYRNWWSAAEATPRFPDRIARRRLLPLPDENAVSTLLGGGRPQRIYVKLEAIEGTPAHTLSKPDGLLTPMPRLDLVSAFRVDKSDFRKRFRNVEDGKVDWTGWQMVRLQDGTNPMPVEPPRDNEKRFGPVDLRALLLCLIWNPGAAVDEKFADSPSALDGLVLKVAGEASVNGKLYKTGLIDVPLVFNTPHHPVIEETVAELSLSIRGEMLYRRFNPVVQPVLRPDAKDLLGFFSATTAAKDPYGWGVLQSLGLAATIRLFDGDRDTFVEAEELLVKVNRVMREVVQRYCDLVEPSTLGAPFTEVLLRPGKDRVPGPFDAMVKMSEGNFKLNDHALALAQISLRPAPLQVFNYARLEFAWSKGLAPRPEGANTFDVGVLFVLTPDAKAPVDILRVADDRTIELNPKDRDKPVFVSPIREPTRSTEPLDPELTLLVRWPQWATLNPQALIKLYVVKRTRTVVDSKIVDIDKVDPVDRKSEFLRPPELPELRNIDRPGKPRSKTTPVPGPDGWITIDPFERFKAKDPADWVAALLDAASDGSETAAQRAFRAFRGHVTASFPKLSWPDRQGFNGALASYPDWAQRFLNYSTGPEGAPRRKDKEGSPLDISPALAAPIKATPWRLAAAADGTQSISFLHSDRWAHARAYALKPYGRYQELAIGAGAYDRTGTASSGREVAEALISRDMLLADDEIWKLLGLDPKDAKGQTPPPALRQPLGYGIAVSPRTERIEPPLILGSGIPKGGKEWQLVVPVHGEESFAFSNRPLFARLGWEGVALSFVRDYSEPSWPSRLKKSMDEPDKIDPILHPEKPPPDSWRRPASAGPAIDRDALADIAREFPSLWKGADIYRIPKLPHYCRSTVLATARAGIVVSPITTITQEVFNTERPDLTAAADGKKFRAALEYRSYRPNGSNETFGTVLRVTLPLVAHYDLMDKEARDIWVNDLPADGAAENVAWWPDPNVVYTLFHRATRNDGAALENEHAEIRLVARPTAAPTLAAPPVEDVPIVVRARGTRFDSLSGAASPRTYPRKIDMRRHRFTLDFCLALKPGASPLASARVSETAKVTPEEIKAFNRRARRTPPVHIPENPPEQYALIASRHELTVTLTPKNSESGTDFFARLMILAKTLGKIAPLWPGLGIAAPALQAEGERLQAWIDTNPNITTPVQLLAAAKLPRKLTFWWPHGIVFPGKPSPEMQDCKIELLGDAQADFPPLLVVLALPSDEDFAKLSTDPDLASEAMKKVLALLAVLARELVTGGQGTLYVRAVHGRGGVSDDFKIEWPEWLDA